MIKATLTKDLEGSEYKIAKEVFIWVAFKHSDTETVNVMLTFHSNPVDAAKNTDKNTNQFSQLAVGITNIFDLKESEFAGFTDLKTQKDNIQTAIIDKITALKLTHISKLEVL
jgi:hypothetical protein